jgi:hypothetical protein
MTSTTDALDRAVTSVASREWQLLLGGRARPATGGRTYESSGIGRKESIEELLSYTELKAVNVLV